MPGECLTNDNDSAKQMSKYTFVSLDMDSTGKRLIDEVIGKKGRVSFHV